MDGDLTCLDVAIICVTGPTSGGATNYEAALVDMILSLEDKQNRFHFYFPRSATLSQPCAGARGRVHTYRASLAQMIGVALRSSLPTYSILRRIGLSHGRLERHFKRRGIDVAYFLSPNPLALGLVDTPMISTVWDVGHRDLPEFIEITGNRHFEERELFFRSVLPKSFRVIVETDHTASRLSSLYGLDPKRVRKIGLAVALTSDEIDSRKGETNHDQYFLYPAQFWPHKRHILLLNAFSRLAATHSSIRLVLTGSDKGNLNHVQNRIRELALTDRIEIKGFVDDEELRRLYKGAQAVVFPSSLGPSNLPPIEAISCGTPVLVSNVHHDPILNHELVKVVVGQTEEAWFQAMTEALDAPRLNGDTFSSSSSEDAKFTITEILREFRQVRSEWS